MEDQTTVAERDPRWQQAWTTLDQMENAARELDRLLPGAGVGAIVMRGVFDARRRLIEGKGGLGESAAE